MAALTGTAFLNFCSASFDKSLEFGAKFLRITPQRHGGAVGQRTNGRPSHKGTDVGHVVDIGVAPVPVTDAF